MSNFYLPYGRFVFCPAKTIREEIISRIVSFDDEFDDDERDGDRVEGYEFPVLAENNDNGDADKETRKRKAEIEIIDSDEEEEGRDDGEGGTAGQKKKDPEHSSGAPIDMTFDSDDDSVEVKQPKAGAKKDNSGKRRRVFDDSDEDDD